jgi:acetyl-CoA acyltransferase 1
MSGRAALLAKNPDDVVIGEYFSSFTDSILISTLTSLVSAKRTPMCKATKGALKDARFEDMLSAAFKGAISAAGIDPRLIEDIQVGTVRTPRGGASIARMAALHAGIPIETSISTVNRQCSSSLQAIWTIANEIRTGDIDIGIAGGCESMTHHYNRTPLDHPTSDEVRSTKLAADCLIPMGITNENVAAE